MDRSDIVPARTLVDDRRDFTTDQTVTLSPNGINVDGPGVLDTLLVRATSPDYRILVETESAEFISDSFETLRTLSDDLDHITAFDDDGDHVTVVDNVPFREESRASVTPTTEMTFVRVRGVWIQGVPVTF